jgi:hypothetical protein
VRWWCEDEEGLSGAKGRSAAQVTKRTGAERRSPERSEGHKDDEEDEDEGDEGDEGDDEVSWTLALFCPWSSSYQPAL